MDVCVLLPVYNDWTALAAVLDRLAATLEGRPEQFRVLAVDDGSTYGEAVSLTLPARFASGSVLHLRRNLGHQRAIAIGLSWLHETCPPDAVVVMDSDGEDKPEDVPRLLDRFAASSGPLSVFAERTRRSEGVVFTSLYKLYQLLHRIATGIPVKIGNFSVLSREHLDSVVTSSDAWNHYAAAMVRLGVPIETIPTERGTRIHGSSKMNFVSLMRHGMSALAVFYDVIAVRSLVMTGILCALGVVLLAACIAIRVFTDWAVPGWATYVSAFILVILLQLLSLTFSVTLHAFSGSTGTPFLPARDYAHFVRAAEPIPSASCRECSGTR